MNSVRVFQIVVLSFFIILGVVLYAQSGHAINSTDVISYFKFDVANTTQYSAHTLAANLTVTNASFNATGKINGAYDYNTSNSAPPVKMYMVGYPGSLKVNATQTFSINFWINPSSAPNSHYIINDGANNLIVWVLNPRNVSCGTNGGYRISNTSLPLNTWTMVTCTWAKNATGAFSDINIFYNSTNVSGTATAGVYGLPNSTNITLMTDSSLAAGTTINGSLDELGFFNRQLNTSDLSELYNNGTGLQYPFTATSAPEFLVTATDRYDGSSISNFTTYIDGSGITSNGTTLNLTTLTDMSGNNRTLTNNNTATYNAAGYYTFVNTSSQFLESIGQPIYIGNYTLNATFIATSNQSNGPSIVAAMDTANGNPSMSMAFFNATAIQCTTSTVNSSGSVAGTNTVAYDVVLNTWVTASCQYTLYANSTFEINLTTDGVARRSSTRTNVIGFEKNGTVIRIAAQKINFARFFNGSVANVSLYNSSGFQAYYPFTNWDNTTKSITVAKDQYFNYTAANYNTSTDLTASMFQAQVAFNATEIISGTGVTGFTVTAPNGKNINTSTSNALYIKAGTYNLTWNKTGWYNRTIQFTVTALENDTQTLTEVYASILNITAKSIITGSTISTYTVNTTSGSYTYNVTNSTTNGSVYLPWANDTGINVTMYTYGYATTSNVTNITTGGVTNITIYAYTSESITFRIYDEVTGILMNGTNVTLLFSSSVYGTNRTTNNGTLYIDLLTPAIYTVTYSANNYNQRQYYVTVYNSTTQSVVLYLRPTSASTNVLLQVKDTSLQSVVGAYVYANVRNASGYNDYLVEMCQTDVNGQCVISADVSTSTVRSNTTYRFTVVYNGRSVGDSGYTTISTTANSACNSALPCVQLIVSLTSNPLASLYAIPSFQITPISYSNNVFSFTFIDSSGLVENVCLYTYRRTGAIDTLTNGSCVSSASASISIFSNVSLGDETTAYAYATIAGQQILLDSDSRSNTGIGSSGNAMFLIFVALFVLGGIFFAYKDNVVMAVIMVCIGLNILLLVSALPGLVKGVVVAVECLLAVLIARLR